MKRLVTTLALAALLIGCSTTTAYKTIGATETSVITANQAYLDLVVTGKVSTNSVPTVEASFNDTQMALRLAAAVASGGTNAAVPAAVDAKASAFITQTKTAK